MSVDYRKCDILDCDNIFVCDAWKEQYVLDKYGSEYGICPSCAKHITKEMLYEDEDSWNDYLQKKYYKIKKEKIILNNELI